MCFRWLGVTQGHRHDLEYDMVISIVRIIFNSGRLFQASGPADQKRSTLAKLRSGARFDVDALLILHSRVWVCFKTLSDKQDSCQRVLLRNAFCHKKLLKVILLIHVVIVLATDDTIFGGIRLRQCNPTLCSNMEVFEPLNIRVLLSETLSQPLHFQIFRQQRSSKSFIDDTCDARRVAV